MAQTAYDLNYFTPARDTGNVKKTQKRRTAAPKAKKKHLFNVFALIMAVGLVVGLLNTQAKITQIQGEITSMKKELHEAEAVYDSLNLTLESTVNLMTVEERAKEMGLVKMDTSRVSYIRAKDSSSIEISKTGLSKWLDGAQNGFMDMVRYLMPGR